MTLLKLERINTSKLFPGLICSAFAEIFRIFSKQDGYAGIVPCIWDGMRWWGCLSTPFYVNFCCSWFYWETKALSYVLIIIIIGIRLGILLIASEISPIKFNCSFLLYLVRFLTSTTNGAGKLILSCGIYGILYFSIRFNRTIEQFYRQRYRIKVAHKWQTKINADSHLKLLFLALKYKKLFLFFFGIIWSESIF